MPPAKKKAAPARKPAKKKVAATLRDRLMTAVAPADSWATATRMQPGLSVEPHIDRLLAAGFPSMVTVVDEPLPSEDHDKAVKKVDMSFVVPRPMVARLFALERWMAPEDKQVAFAREPTPFELASVVDAELRSGVWDRVWLLEAMFGSVPVGEAFVAALAKVNNDTWLEHKFDGYAASVIYALSAVLDRTPAEVHTRLRGVLEKRYEDLGEIKGYSGRALDVILHGRAGVERSAGRFGNIPTNPVHLGMLCFAHDDRTWVAEQILSRVPTLNPNDRACFDARHVVVGGRGVLGTLRGSIDRLLKIYKAPVMEQLALFP